nr:unnamed protein product [Callosobruchus analis]
MDKRMVCYIVNIRNISRKNIRWVCTSTRKKAMMPMHDVHGFKSRIVPAVVWIFLNLNLEIAVVHLVEQLVSNMSRYKRKGSSSDINSKVVMIEERLEAGLEEIKNQLGTGHKNPEAVSSLIDKINQLESSIKSSLKERATHDTRTLPDTIANFISAKFKIEVTVADINFCYRMGAGARADKNGKHPRPVAVYFVNRWLRDKVFFAKSNLKGSGVVMSEILTENALQLYKQTKTILGAKNVWTWRETWLDDSISDDDMHINNYNFIRLYRGSRGGGVGFYIRNDLKYSVLQKNEKIELIWVKVAIGDTSFALSVSYRAPSDFNIDLLDFESTKAKYVTDIIEGFGMKQLVKQPTRITENSATLIDYIVVSNEEIVSDVGTIHAAEFQEGILLPVSKA